MTLKYLPEGALLNLPRNKAFIGSRKGLESAQKLGEILEAVALSCDNDLNLTVRLGEGLVGVIPRREATLPLPDRKEKDIAVISRVGKAVCFKVLGFGKKDNRPCVFLSRRAAQEDCLENHLRHLLPGQILSVRVTHEEPFGAFVDIGCGIVSLLSIDCISVSRISHPRDRFACGDFLRAAVKCIDRQTGRIYMTEKELLGSWEENAALFEPGQTVAGLVRSIEDYGIFVELTPNRAGLAETKEGVSVSDRATVFTKSINPERMKIKLVLIDSYKDFSAPAPLRYFLPEDCNHLSSWRYSPDCCPKSVGTVF